MNMILLFMILITQAVNGPISNVCNYKNKYCAQTVGCAFVNGVCEVFAECELYEPQMNIEYSCEVISKYCIWDGRAEFCQDKKYCKDMNTQECGNINQLNGDKHSCELKEDKCQQKECQSYSYTDCELHRDDCFKSYIYGECLDNGKQCEQYQSTTKCSNITPPLGECFYNHEGQCKTKECENYFGDTVQICEQYQNLKGQKCTYKDTNTIYCSTPNDTLIVQGSQPNDCILDSQLCYQHSECVDKECFKFQDIQNCNQQSDCIYDNYLCRSKFNTCVDIFQQVECNRLIYCEWQNNLIRVKKQCSEIENKYQCPLNQQLSGIPCFWLEGYGCNSKQRCEGYDRIYCDTTLSLDGDICALNDNGQCQIKKCNLFTVEECNSISYCFYTGKECENNTEKYCQNYERQPYCTSDQDGNPCIWNDKFLFNQQCQKFTKCSDISNLNSSLECSLYSAKCITTYDSDYLKYKCVPKIKCRTSDYRYYGDSFQKCQVYSDNCASNGIHCIPITDCQNYVESVCQDSIDLNDNLCFWNQTKCQQRLAQCQDYSQGICNQQTTFEGVKCYLDGPICRSKQCTELEPINDCDSLNLCIEIKKNNVCQPKRCKLIEKEKKCILIKNKCIQHRFESLCNIQAASEGDCRWEQNKCILTRQDPGYKPEEIERVNPMKDSYCILIVLAAVQLLWQL